MTTSLETKLRTAAAAYAPLTALLGTSPFRWYDTQLVQGTAFPAIAVLLIINTPTYAYAGPLTSGFQRMQFTVWDTDPERGRQVEAALYDFIAEFNGADPAAQPANTILSSRGGFYPQTQPPQFQRIIDARIFNSDT